MSAKLKYGSVCSGIEAATQAWHGLGWEPVFFSEIEKFPASILSHHYGSNMPGEPLSTNGVPNYGDFTQITADAGPVDLLVGGTPCQSFSSAGKRLGLDDPRGNLALEFLALAKRLCPRWLVWENVPGVLYSRSDGGSYDFATFLSFVLECGYGFAYRVLDAQYVRVDNYPRAVPQRRRRVFLVGYLGDWRRAAAVLFEPESMSGNSPPRREAGQGLAGTASGNTGGGSGLARVISERSVSGMVSSNRSKGSGGPSVDACQNLVAFSFCDDGGDAVQNISPTLRSCGGYGIGRCGHVAVCYDLASGLAAHGNIGPFEEFTPTLRGKAAEQHAVEVRHADPPVSDAFDQNTRDEVRLQGGDGSVCGVLAAKPGAKHQTYLCDQQLIRRLTPVECERLQGFPDDYTKIPWNGKGADECPIGHRYKALGNSMAINVMRWIGQRIGMMEGLNR